MTNIAVTASPTNASISTLEVYINFDAANSEYFIASTIQEAIWEKLNEAQQAQFNDSTEINFVAYIDGLDEKQLDVSQVETVLKLHFDSLFPVDVIDQLINDNGFEKLMSTIHEFYGAYASRKELAKEIIDGSENIPDYLLCYIDWEQMGKDYALDFSQYKSDDGLTYYFQ
jgi:hypothetical protein